MAGLEYLGIFLRQTIITNWCLAPSAGDETPSNNFSSKSCCFPIGDNLASKSCCFPVEFPLSLRTETCYSYELTCIVYSKRGIRTDHLTFLSRPKRFRHKKLPFRLLRRAHCNFVAKDVGTYSQHNLYPLACLR